MRYRSSERILLAYYLYVAILATTRGLATGVPWLVLLAAAALFRWLPLVVRDWLMLAGVLVAYREMDLFSAAAKPRALERQWLAWDHGWLFDRGFREAIESLGPVIPFTLELSYLLVYGVGVAMLAVFYIARRAERADRFLTMYLTGTLLAYALFPYFPSDPPRVLFPTLDMPQVVTWARRLNLALVGGYGIHSSVFPSAHVSSAFSAAWGAWRLLPEYKWVGRIALAYASIVAAATIYGRYHYAADAVAGFAVSLIALL